MEILINKIHELKKGQKKYTLKTDFKGKNSLLYSIDNTEGKTTILRSIIFNLGFDVKKISEGYDKTNPSLKIEFSINDVNYEWIRDFEKPNKIIENLPNSNIYLLPDDGDDIAQILGFDNYKFMNDFLGAIYIDQDFGWRTINHGRVHPERKLKFNFPQLLSKIYGNSTTVDDEIENKIQTLSSQKKTITNMISSFKNGDEKQISIEHKTTLRKINILDSKIKKYKIMNKKRKRIPNEITSFLKLIHTNEILNRIIPKEKQDIIKNIKKYELQLSEEEIKNNKRHIEKMEEQKEVLENMINNKISLFESSDNTDAAINNVIKLSIIINNIKEGDLSNKLNEIKEGINGLKLLRKNIKEKNANIYNKVFHNIQEKIKFWIRVDLGVTPNAFMSWKQDPIFNSFSGAKKAFLVLFTRFIIHKEFYEKTKIKLPFIIDTIVSFDPSDKSKEILFELLKMIKNNVSQLIIANVNTKMNDELNKKIGLIKLPAIKSDFKYDDDQVSLEGL